MVVPWICNTCRLCRYVRLWLGERRPLKPWLAGPVRVWLEPGGREHNGAPDVGPIRRWRAARSKGLGCLKVCSFVRIWVSAESVPVSALLSQAQGGGPVKPSKRSLISLAFFFVSSLVAPSFVWSFYRASHIHRSPRKACFQEKAACLGFHFPIPPMEWSSKWPHFACLGGALFP